MPDNFEGDMSQSAREMKNNEAEHGKGVVAVFEILEGLELQIMTQGADHFKYDFFTSIPKITGTVYLEN